MSRSQNLYFRICRKAWIKVNLNQFWFSIVEDDMKINDMVIENNVSTIKSETKMDQEFYQKVKVKVTKSISSKMKKNSDFSLFESIFVRIAEATLNPTEFLYDCNI